MDLRAARDLGWTRTFGTLAVLSTVLLTACNSLTGADQLAIVGGGDDAETEGEGGDDWGGPTSGSGAGPTTGSGGNTGEGAGHEGGNTTTTTSSSSSSSTTSSSSSSTTSSSTTTTTTPSPVDCEYPDGVGGVDVGDLVAGNLAWQGYSEGASQSGTVSIQDYLDCDGSKGINALLIINSATWCGACQTEATDLPSYVSTFENKGIRVLTLMVENQSGAPATLSTATSWRDYFGLEDLATAADPNFTFAGFGSVGLPLQILVNPRTMKIVDRTEGYGGYDAVIQLANQNAN